MAGQGHFWDKAKRGFQENRIWSGKCLANGDGKTNTKDKQNMRIGYDICRIQRQISPQKIEHPHITFLNHFVRAGQQAEENFRLV